MEHSKKSSKIIFAEIQQKVIQGTSIAIKRLIEKKKRENGYLLILENGKVKKIKAVDIE